MKRSHYALGLLAVTNLISFINRNVIFGLFDPIKADLALSDTQLGWLASAYVLIFSLSALPFGIVSDLRSRRAVITLGIVLWSAFTMASGFAVGFPQLLICRALVGMGAAAFSAAAQSMVADYFPLRGRAVALGILAAGILPGGRARHLAGWPPRGGLRMADGDDRRQHSRLRARAAHCPAARPRPKPHVAVDSGELG